MSKKLISVVLALVLVLSSFAVSAFAGIGDYAFEEVNEETGEIPYNQTWTLGTPDDSDGDGEWTVDVSLETDYRVGAIQFVIANADKNAVLADVEINAGVFGKKATVEFSPEGKVLIVPKPSSGADKGPELTDGPVIATLYYTLKDGASSAKIAIDNNPKNEEFVDGTLIAVRMSDDSLVSGTSIYGQNVLSTGEEQTIGTEDVAEPPTLGVVDGTNGVIDTTRTALLRDEITFEPIEDAVTGYIYGLDPDYNYEISEMFEVVGDGELEFIPQYDTEMATGTIVNVLDLDGNVVESYVLIIFGDVNCDGYADASDADDIFLHEGGAYGLDAYTGEDLFGFYGVLPPYAEFAGDIAVDGYTDAADADDIFLHEGSALGLDPYTGEIVFGSDTGRISPEFVISEIANL